MIHVDVIATALQSTGWADINALEALGAFVADDFVGRTQVDRLLGAGVSTVVTADALLCIIGEFVTGVDAFRILAPGTRQRAALEEHHTANARPVVQGVSLDVEVQRCLPWLGNCYRINQACIRPHDCSGISPHPAFQVIDR